MKKTLLFLLICSNLWAQVQHNKISFNDNLSIYYDSFISGMYGMSNFMKDDSNKVFEIPKETPTLFFTLPKIEVRKKGFRSELSFFQLPNDSIHIHQSHDTTFISSRFKFEDELQNKMNSFDQKRMKVNFEEIKEKYGEILIQSTEQLKQKEVLINQYKDKIRPEIYELIVLNNYLSAYLPLFEIFNEPKFAKNDLSKLPKSYVDLFENLNDKVTDIKLEHYAAHSILLKLFYRQYANYQLIKSGKVLNFDNEIAYYIDFPKNKKRDIILSRLLYNNYYRKAASLKTLSKFYDLLENKEFYFELEENIDYRRNITENNTHVGLEIDRADGSKTTWSNLIQESIGEPFLIQMYKDYDENVFRSQRIQQTMDRFPNIKILFISSVSEIEDWSSKITAFSNKDDHLHMNSMSFLAKMLQTFDNNAQILFDKKGCLISIELVNMANDEYFNLLVNLNTEN